MCTEGEKNQTKIADPQKYLYIGITNPKVYGKYIDFCATYTAFMRE